MVISGPEASKLAQTSQPAAMAATPGTSQIAANFDFFRILARGKSLAG
jgi:hypothetical protein